MTQKNGLVEANAMLTGGEARSIILPKACTKFLVFVSVI